MQSREDEKLGHKDEKTKSSAIKKKILEIFKRPPLSRSTSQLAYLMKVTEHIKFFKDLNEEAQDNDVHRQCCQYFTLETYPKGHPVIVINTVGEKFYIILTGTVSVHIMKQIDDKSETPELKKVATMGAGQSFGELALIADQPRMATILCEEECDFLVLSKRAFDRILKYKKMLNSKLSYLESLPLFAEVNKSFVREIYSRSEYVTFVAKQSVFLEGEDAKAMYIVTKGMFKGMKRFYVEKKQDNELSQKRLEEKPMDDFRIQEKRRDFKLMQIITYNPNDYFGEQELVEGTKRNYTVLCDSVEGELLVIKKSLFLSKVVGDQRGKQRMAEYIFQKKCLQKNKFSQIQEQVNKFWQYLREDRQQLKNNLELAEEIRCRKQKAESRTEISSDEEDFFRESHQQASQQLIQFNQKDLLMSEVHLRRAQSKNEMRSSIKIGSQLNSSPRFHQQECAPVLMKTLSINTMDDIGQIGKSNKKYNNPAYFSGAVSSKNNSSLTKSPLLQATRRKYSDNSSLASSQEITSLRKIQDFKGDINNRVGNDIVDKMEFKLIPRQVQNDSKVGKELYQDAAPRKSLEQSQLGESMQCILLRQLDGLKENEGEDDIVVKKQEALIPATKSISSQQCPQINMNLSSGDYIISSYDQFKDLIKFGNTKIDLKINEEDPQESNQKPLTFDYLKDQRQTNIFKAFNSLKNKINKKHQHLISQECLPKEGVPLITTINPERRPSIPLASRPSTSSSSSGQSSVGLLASQLKQQQHLLVSNSQDLSSTGKYKSEKSSNKDKCSTLISGIFHAKSISSGNISQISQQKNQETQSNSVAFSNLDNQRKDKPLQNGILSSPQQVQEELFPENTDSNKTQNQLQIPRNSWGFSETSMTDSPTLNYFHSYHKSQNFLARNATSPSLLQIPSPSFLQLPSESTTTTTMLESEQQVLSPLETKQNSQFANRIHSQHSHRKSLSVKALHLALKNCNPISGSSSIKDSNNISRFSSNHDSYEDKYQLQSKNLNRSSSSQQFSKTTATTTKTNSSNEVLAAINSMNNTTAATATNSTSVPGTSSTFTSFPAKGNFSYHFNSSSPIKTIHTYITCNNVTPVVIEDSAEAENTPFNNPKQADKCSFLFSSKKESLFENYSQVFPPTPLEQSDIFNLANSQSESAFFNSSSPFYYQANFKPKNAMRPFSAVSQNSDCKNPFFNSLNANNFLKSSSIKRNRLLSPQQKKNSFRSLPGTDGIAQSSPNAKSPALFVSVGYHQQLLKKASLNEKRLSEIMPSPNQQKQANMEGRYINNNALIVNSSADSSQIKGQNSQLIRRPVTGGKLHFGNSVQNISINKRDSLQICSATQTPGGIAQDYS